MSRLLVVSNRLPVTIKHEHGAAKLVPSTGGLATAMQSLGSAAKRSWIGWPGDVGRATAEEVQQLDAKLSAARLVPVHLSASEVAHYYDGFSNGVLWPLLHYATDKVRLDAERDWSVYRSVNQRFAERIAAMWRPGDRVWIHDYQLALVPAMVRELLAGKKPRIGFFLHVPFPAPEVFAILPWRRDIVAGMMGADLVGFHTEGYCENFRGTAAMLTGAESRGRVLRTGGRTVRVSTHPIGIDARSFSDLADGEEVRQALSRLKADARGRKIVLGVDRLDYTKGIPRRLHAFDRFLERNPAWREKVLFVQLAVPSREKVDAYSELRRTVNELVGRINGQHGTATGGPVQLLYRAIPRSQLVALYRAADVMLVTPLRDGMNLVAKEYVASRTDERGVLVLSELAGAAADLEEAVVVNPYDIECLSRSIRSALEMPEPEQRSRMSRLRTRVFEGDVERWAARFVAELEAAPEVQEAESLDALA